MQDPTEATARREHAYELVGAVRKIITPAVSQLLLAVEQLDPVEGEAKQRLARLAAAQEELWTELLAVQADLNTEIARSERPRRGVAA